MEDHDERGGFARRLKNVRPSFVRAMMARMGRQDMISLAGGLPNPGLFPAREISEAAAAVLAEPGAEALQYTSTEGCEPLREYVAREFLTARGLPASAEEVLIVNGSQQALDLAAKAFLEPGDKVLVELPSYMAALQVFDLFEASYVSMPLLSDGPDLDVMAGHLASGEVRMMYAGTSFQNPTGLSWSEEKRRAAGRLLEGRDLLVLEDNAYGELVFEGRPLPYLALFNQGRHVLMGSFSKVLAPGLRMGWVHSDRDTIGKMGLAKQASDLCSNHLTQRILCRYLERNDLELHIRRLREFYRERRDLMLELLERYMPEGTTWSRPGGGMFVWAELPETVSAEELLARTLERGVAFAPGESFFAEKPRRNAMRLNFSHPEPEAMEKGIRILAEEAGSLLREAGTGRKTVAA